MAGVGIEGAGGGHPGAHAKHAQPRDGRAGGIDWRIEDRARGQRARRQVASAQDFQRKAQFYLDFVEAENSSGFHAPQEALRILGESINFARKGQLALRPPVPSP